MSLLQGNVQQDLKFDPQVRADTFDRYLRLVERSRGRLIVLPESAFPMFSDEVPDTVLLSLIRMASARDGDVLLGCSPPSRRSREATSRATTTPSSRSATATLQFYRKHHLVPFGETIPLKPVIGWFVRSVLAIPLADQARGGATQPALAVAGQRVAVNICYEDAFGSELIHGAREAHAARQRDERRVVRPFDRRRAAHADRRDARARARTADAARDQHRHHVRDRPRRPRDRAPAAVHDRRLEVVVAGREGATPYLRFGDLPVLALSFAACSRPARTRRHHRPGKISALCPIRSASADPGATDADVPATHPALQSYWDRQGCALLQPYDMEVGAGTFHTATFLRALGPEPWNAAYVQPSRRPKDGRYGENPNRLQHYYQYQVVLKPSPADILDLYLGSLEALGFDLRHNDVRFVEDDWETPTLGAWGLGWEVWLNGMEVTQFTYFQQVGGLDCKPVTGEITYGLERLAMYLQGKENVFDLVWTTTSATARAASPTATSTTRTRSSSRRTTSSTRTRECCSSSSRSSRARRSACSMRACRCPPTRWS